MKSAAVILAAGQGIRMRSALTKVLHPVAGKPMLWHVLQAVGSVTTEKPVVIVGHGAEDVNRFVGEGAVCVQQQPQLGTAHAVLQARPALKDKAEHIVVVYGDMPLLRADTLAALVRTAQRDEGSVAMLTVQSDEARGFGRVVRGEDGRIAAVVEEYVASAAQLGITELNVGAYCFPAAWLWDALDRIPKNASKGEFYLTDAVELAVREGLRVHAAQLMDKDEAIGVNTRVHLAEVEGVMRKRINEGHMLAGVTMADPASTYIDAGVVLGQDTTIMANTRLAGATVAGENCTLGPNSVIVDSRIGQRCRVVASMLEGALLDDDVSVGPFARLRPGARLMNGVHIGNFGEVKDSTLGPGVKVGHFSYIGNATIGAETNIGAGTITCNFDGEKKNTTVIGEHVFIGSDTMLVAPLTIGNGARTGAGSVVTRDVPADTLVVGMPARAIKKASRRPKKT